MRNTTPQSEIIPDFSFLIQTRNNRQELKMSVESVCSEAPPASEMVVVDGSDEPFGEDYMREIMSNANIGLVYRLDERLGPYNAMNVGIKNSCGRWVIVITAGDTLEKGAGLLLESIKDSDHEVVVFSQNVVDQYGHLSYQFYPTEKSAWPHQSVVIRREVHERLGMYPTECNYTSDQLFFAGIRTKTKFMIRPEILSTFRLGGITSGAPSLRRLRGIYVVSRKLGRGHFLSALHGYLFPCVRFILERYPVFRGVVNRFRRAIYPHYKKPVNPSATSSVLSERP